MNPVDRLNIDNFEEIVEEVGKIRSEDYLACLERKFVNEVVTLVLQTPSRQARNKLNRIKKFITNKQGIYFRKPLFSAFLNASQGAVDAALNCL